MQLYTPALCKMRIFMFIILSPSRFFVCSRFWIIQFHVQYSIQWFVIATRQTTPNSHIFQTIYIINGFCVGRRRSIQYSSTLQSARETCDYSTFTTRLQRMEHGQNVRKQQFLFYFLQHGMMNYIYFPIRKQICRVQGNRVYVHMSTIARSGLTSRYKIYRGTNTQNLS